jgi:hypothetical protein
MPVMQAAWPAQALRLALQRAQPERPWVRPPGRLALRQVVPQVRLERQ